MDCWPLPTLQELPATDEEQYQAFISYANAAGWMLALYRQAHSLAFASRGIVGDPSAQPTDVKHRVVESLTPMESDASFTLFHYWLGATQVLLEGWDTLGLIEPEIDRLLAQSEHRARLRRVRHAVFHYQKTLRHSQFTDFYRESHTVGPWVQSLHHSFSRFIADNPTRPKGNRRANTLGQPLSPEAQARRRLAKAAEALQDAAESVAATVNEVRQAVEAMQAGCVDWLAHASPPKRAGC